MRKPTELLKGAIERFKTNPKLFIGIVLVPIIASVLTAVFAPSKGTGVINIYEWIVYIALSLALLVTNVLMSVALIIAAHNPTIGVKEAYSGARMYFWKYIGFSLLMMVILLPAFILFVIPAIILGVWFTFATFILVLENSAIIDSFKTSRAYVKGKWWTVFGRLVFVFFLLIVIMIPFGILASFMPASKAMIDTIGNLIALLISPITILYVYLMYQDVKAPTGSVNV